MRTIGSLLEEGKGYAGGFDLLRIVLATSVVAWHSVQVATGYKDMDTDRFWWLPGYGILVMFFGLSGFLIAGSALRLNLRDFLINRGLRIFPALGVVVVSSVFILGPIFTTLSLQAYFTNHQTYHYLSNAVGLIYVYLPGVFTTNPSHGVNYSLWTVPQELFCYVVMSVLILSGALRRPRVVLLLVGIWIVLGLVAVAIDPASGSLSMTARLAADGRSFWDRFLPTLLVGRASRLLVSFILGVVVYLYRYKLPYDWRIFWVIVVAMVGMALSTDGSWLTFPIMNALLAPALVYLCAFIGVTRMPMLSFISKNDYSYGIYLCGAPIQQALRAATPLASNPLLNFVLAMPLIVLFAMFSWHTIEKRALGLRKRFSLVANVRGEGEATEGPVDVPSAPTPAPVIPVQ
jgi:peptidoglycan/LPS O-acetylase OafA/YrhL